MRSYLGLDNGRDIPCKATLWSMAFIMIDALQSAVMLLAVTRLCGAETGGVFAIAYATAQLMYAVGTYYVRTFHATDTQVPIPSKLCQGTGCDLRGDGSDRCDCLPVARLW